MYLKLGIRNIFKNRRRSLVTGLAIALGFMAMNLFEGYIKSVYSGLTEEAIIGERLGHLTIAKQGYFTEGRLNPTKYVFNADELERLTETLRTNSEIKLLSPRLAISGLVSNGNISTIFISEGIVPEHLRILRGSYADLPGNLDPAKTNGVAIAKGLAEMLGLQKNDDAVIVTNTSEGMINALDIEVGDIFNTGNSGTNDKFLLMPFAYAQRLFDLQGADRVVVLLNDLAAIETARQRIGAALDQAGLDVEIKDWQVLSNFYNQVKGLFDMIFLFIFIIVFVIVMMGIINTMSMSVMERTREIGTLRALGMQRLSVVRLFSTEGILLAVLGCAIGLLLTLLVAIPINMADISYIPPNASAPVPLQIQLEAGGIISTLVFLVVVAAFSALLPARRAARMQIVDALGHI